MDVTREDTLEYLRETFGKEFINDLFTFMRIQFDKYGNKIHTLYNKVDFRDIFVKHKQARSNVSEIRMKTSFYRSPTIGGYVVVFRFFSKTRNYLVLRISEEDCKKYFNLNIR